jgi:hypothetical protein
MKKTLLAVIAILSALPFVSKAQWTTSGTNIYNSNSGNVGIGATVPWGKLDVQGAPIDANVGSFRLLDPTPQAQNTGGYMTFGGWRTATGAMSDWAGIRGGKENSTNDDYSGYLSFATRVSGSTTTERMRISSTGKVGIGTTTPGSLLNLYSSAPALQVSPSVYGGTNYSSYFGSLSTAVGVLQLGNDSQNDIVAGNTNAGGYLRFIVNNSNTFPGAANGTLAMQINANGKVGIGTSIPDQLLTVKGTIHSQEVKVDLSVPGPDYVFHPTYKLPTLTEVKDFIDKNQHLSEIPSAAEMAKNGLDLGDMNMKLLKKVEELTLYLIEKDKQLTQEHTANIAQQKQIDELNNKLEILLKQK